MLRCSSVSMLGGGSTIASAAQVILVPSGEALTFGDDNFVSLEAAGVKEARNAAFVLVAGGLGERLGYKGIKVALPRETTTGKCFLQHYIESILSLQEASWKMEGECHTKIPFAIRTSDDTNALTIKLLETNSYFGMEPSQVKILKQEKVACLADNDARLALGPNDKYKIQTKPHGHGDAHSLLYSSGLLEQWKSTGRRWVLFFQDTNGLLFDLCESISFGFVPSQPNDCNFGNRRLGQVGWTAAVAELLHGLLQFQGDTTSKVRRRYIEEQKEGRGGRAGAWRPRR
ncbi:hypothetical protein ZWY2020_056898 [Hordeum vulgare]|nr:hypothetical protein ZWY2020_056898 [Hordeum vulgare]